MVWHDDAALKPVVKMDWLQIEDLIPGPGRPELDRSRPLTLRGAQDRAAKESRRFSPHLGQTPTRFIVSSSRSVPGSR